MNTIPIHTHQERYLDPHQARKRPPTSYEVLLGDAIERAFGAGLWELDSLVAQLNKTGPLGPSGAPWTVQSYQAVIKTLGA
ncbi:MAG: recombinase-like helix-turn-helix domain-containing protein [Burkholderiaceae bacterium]